MPMGSVLHRMGRGGVKIPQIGRVLISNDDSWRRIHGQPGALDATVNEGWLKLDNLVVFGHNCVIGKNSVMAGCAGIAGSTVFGEHCIVGGADGLGHLNIAGPGRPVSGRSSVDEEHRQARCVYQRVSH